MMATPTKQASTLPVLLDSTHPKTEMGVALIRRRYIDETGVTAPKDRDVEHWGWLDDDGLQGVSCVRPRRTSWPDSLIPATLLWAWLHPSQRGHGLMSTFIRYRFGFLDRNERGIPDVWVIDPASLSDPMRAVLRGLPKGLWPDNIGPLDIFTGESRKYSPIYRWSWWDLSLHERLPSMLDAYRAGTLSRDDARVQMLPLWSECIEDDSADTWLSTWRDITDDGTVQLTDSDELPRIVNEHDGRVRIYRGEGSDVGDTPRGMAWSTQREVAVMFAIERPWATAPVIYSGTVELHRVLAYITWSNESEIVVDPDDVTITEKHSLAWVPMTRGAVQTRAFRHRMMLADALVALQRDAEP